MFFLRRDCPQGKFQIDGGSKLRALWVVEMLHSLEILGILSEVNSFQENDRIAKEVERLSSLCARSVLSNPIRQSARYLVVITTNAYSQRTKVEDV